MCRTDPGRRRVPNPLDSCSWILPWVSKHSQIGAEPEAAGEIVSDVRRRDAERLDLETISGIYCRSGADTGEPDKFCP